MDASSELRRQIQSLSIDRKQRPAEQQGRSSGWLKILFLLVLLGGGGYAWYAGWISEGIARLQAALPTSSADASKPPATKAATGPAIVRVTRQAPAATGAVLTASGKIVSDHRVVVATKVSGQIVELKFEQGDHVEKGQTLARIEDVIYVALRDQAAAQLAKAKANLTYRKFNHERVEAMYHGQDAVEVEMADARRALHEAEGELAAAEAAVTYAQKQAHDTEVVAPIAGVVLERNVEVGDFVAAEGGRGANANATFAEIADMTKLRVEVDVSELDIGRVHPDMACTIAPDAYKDAKFTGHVMWIDPGANYSKATVQAKVRIDNPDWRLRVGGAAQVAFLPDKSDKPEETRAGFWIPQSAVLQDTGEATGRVFVVNNGKATATPVKLGAKSGAQIEALEGLSEGQSILDPVEGVRDGQKVRTN